MKLTIRRARPDGVPLLCGYSEDNEKPCTNYQVEEFFGYCEHCWLKLTPVERAILQGKEPPVVEQVIIKETIFPPRPSVFVKVFGLIWKIAITSVVCYLIWNVR